MAKSNKYIAKRPDANGYIHYTDDEHSIWRELITGQNKLLEGQACAEYLTALDRLALPHERIPQCGEISEVLLDTTGWRFAPVAALISFDEFFRMLSQRIFPAASFIRSRAEMQYLQEPDIFHEIFGHAPLLTDPRFAAFTHAYGKAGLAADKRDRAWLARLYWFTVEFGLIREAEALRVFGAGIVSSSSELPYSLESDIPQRRRFDPVDALRTPYRIDILQSVYFVLESIDDLFELASRDLLALIDEARRLGMHPPTYLPKQSAA